MVSFQWGKGIGGRGGHPKFDMHILVPHACYMYCPLNPSCSVTPKLMQQVSQDPIMADKKSYTL
jgi:hypothetical protein